MEETGVASENAPFTVPVVIVDLVGVDVPLVVVVVDVDGAQDQRYSHKKSSRTPPPYQSLYSGYGANY